MANADQKVATSLSTPSTRSTHAQEQAGINEVKHLVLMGGSIILLHKCSKRPIGERWTEAPRLSLEELKARYTGKENFGVRTGQPSEIDGLFWHTVDMDIRKSKYRRKAFTKFETLFEGHNVWSWPRVKSGSDGESRHFHFLTDKPFASRRLAASEGTFEDEHGRHNYWEIDLVGNGRQVVIPPSIHPISRKAYKWEVEFDPTAKLPYVKSDLIEQLVHPDADDNEYHETGPLGLTREEVREALLFLDPSYWREDYFGYRNLGMALKHEFRGAKIGFEIWREYSEPSKKFNLKKLRDHWDSFKERTSRPFTMRSVMKAASAARREAEYAGYADELDEDEADYRQSLMDEFDSLNDEVEDGAPKLDVPKHLQSFPGKLQLVVDYYNATAEKPQPQFAVQAALAIGSGVLGRNFKTNKNNFSTLFLMNVAPTTAGKEHFKTVIEEVLEEAGVGSLLAPDEFSSGAAIFWHLLETPRCITVTDEYGVYMSTGRDSSNTLKRETQKLQMELFSRPHGVVRGIGYSMAKASKEQIEAAKQRKIVRPAFTQTGMTTPETFFEAISNKEVQSGYLNRFIIVRSPLGRQLSRENVPDAEIPWELTQWVKKYVNDHGGTKEDDDRAYGNPSYVFPPRIVPFDEECLLQLKEYEKMLMKKMNAMDRENGMGSLHGRTREIAMRVALIVAVSCESEVIRLNHLEWAWDYVSYYHNQMIEDFSANLGKTAIEDVCDSVAEIITRAGNNGLTVREISRRCRPFRRLSIRDGEEVLARLVRNGFIKLVDIEKEGAGRKRKAYVARKIKP
ncbi:bifunctional DNA primase/polymerase [Microvirga sp. KLBC 81]|uniref:bifunctional DNA primase/polymerase n=1 Tax=Microvirga sp. KLBC 81 TaxID=1862707 RepID=UPI0014031E4F|nr:bifunctional DNA primase/polymerase [Microvirga sp. KLBC 81]